MQPSDQQVNTYIASGGDASITSVVSRGYIQEDSKGAYIKLEKMLKHKENPKNLASCPALQTAGNG
jgi:hypothetical protein